MKIQSINLFKKYPIIFKGTQPIKTKSKIKEENKQWQNYSQADKR